FGTIENNTDEDLVFISAESDSAEMTELHETIVQSDGSSLMQEMEGGITVAAGETYELEPGGDHVMLMMLEGPILPGDQVVVTLTAENGETLDITAVAKEYTGAQETYAPDGSLGNSPHEH